MSVAGEAQPPVAQQQEEAQGVELLPAKRGLIWADLNQERIEEFYAITDADEQIRVLSSWVKVKHYTDNPKSGIMVDFFMYALIFCQEQGFTTEQSSALFSILKLVFEQAFGVAGSESEGGKVLEKAYDVFKTLMLQHAVGNPPQHIMLFAPAEVCAITDYMSKTFFRYYKAYQYVFTQDPELIPIHQRITVDTPMPPLSLSSAYLEKVEPSAD